MRTVYDLIHTCGIPEAAILRAVQETLTEPDTIHTRHKNASTDLHVFSRRFPWGHLRVLAVGSPRGGDLEVEDVLCLEDEELHAGGTRA